MRPKNRAVIPPVFWTSSNHQISAILEVYFVKTQLESDIFIPHFRWPMKALPGAALDGAVIFAGGAG